MAYCSQCGALVEPDFRFCGACGQKIAVDPLPLPVDLPAPKVTPAGTRRRSRFPGLVLLLMIACGAGWYLQQRWDWLGQARELLDMRSKKSPLPATYSDPWKFAMPAPGPVLASATIGSGGGNISVANTISLSLPPGALKKDQQVVIREGVSLTNETSICFVETQGSKHLILEKPARVTVTVPAGIADDQVQPVQEVMNSVFITLPGTFNGATRELTFQTDHFSGIGWAKLQKTAYGVGGSALIMILVCGWSAPISGSGYVVIGVMSTLYGTAVGAPAIQKAVQEVGLTKSLRAPGLEVYWSDEGEHAVPAEMDDDLVYPQPLTATFLFDKQGNLVQTSPLTSDECAQKYPDLVALEVPRSILVLCWELGRVRQYYKQAGYNPPETISVVVRADLDANKEKDVNYGEWDPGSSGYLGYLRMMSAYITSLTGEKSAKRRATISHEYWHAISEANSGFKFPYPWVEEALATAFESEIFPGCYVLADARKWNTVFRVLGHGFVLPGRDDTGGQEHPEKRGYSLWPWGKFLIHKFGHARLKQFIDGEFSEDDMATCFNAFGEALLSSRERLPKEKPQIPSVYTAKGGARLNVPTGWGDLDLSENYAGSSGLGEVRLTGMEQARPLALSLFRANLPDPPGMAGNTTAPPLVIRRRTPDAQERIVVMKSQKNPDLAPPGLLASGMGSLFMAGDTFAQGSSGKSGIAIAVAIINAGSRQAEVPSLEQHNPLWIYYLQPPTSPRVERTSDSASDPNAPINYHMTWTPPTMEGLKPADCLRGFRVVVRNMEGRVFAEPDLLLSPGMAAGDVELRPDYQIWGMASEDYAARDAKGQLLLSPTCLLNPLQGLAEYLLPADSLPLQLREKSREHNDYSEAGATVEMVFQELEGPAVNNDDASDPNPYPDVNPVMPPMNSEPNFDQAEWDRKAKEVAKWAERQSSKPPKKQLAARVVVQRISPALLRKATFRYVLARCEQENGQLVQQSDNTYRTTSREGRRAILYERDDLVLALSSEGDMELLESLKSALDSRVDAVNRRAKP